MMIDVRSFPARSPIRAISVNSRQTRFSIPGLRTTRQYALPAPSLDIVMGSPTLHLFWEIFAQRLMYLASFVSDFPWALCFPIATSWERHSDRPLR